MTKKELIIYVCIYCDIYDLVFSQARQLQRPKQVVNLGQPLALH